MTHHFQLPLFVDKTQLPTGKNHVSYSEGSVWDRCSWEHKCVYIDLAERDPGSVHTAFGHAVHGALQEFMLNSKLQSYFYADSIEEAKKVFIVEVEKTGYKEETDSWVETIPKICDEVPGWLDKEFPGWQVVSAEFPLFEPIEGQTNKYFKGFIDTVIRYPKPPRKGSKPVPEGTPIEWEYWILDWKTTSWGWDMKKKTDKIKRMQLALYKHYFCTKLDIPFEKVRCGFVLLKRTAKDGSRCELVDVSVGDKTREDGLLLMNKMVTSVSKKMFMKNRNSCTYCRFRNTKVCP